MVVPHLQIHLLQKSKAFTFNCEIISRNVEWYHHYYSENLIDTRNKGVMRDNAKYHYSVIEKMLFPISHLIMVVPSILHIVLGVTLRLFNLVEAECIKIDGICKTVDGVNRKASLDAEWIEKSLQLEEIKENMKTNFHKIIEFEKNLSRFNAV